MLCTVSVRTHCGGGMYDHEGRREGMEFQPGGGAQDLQEPISRTMQYKKVTKPLLERKRRARINRCLDELKDLMVGALEAEGENVSKLEKADILELTVRHLHKLHTGGPRDAVEEAQKFQAGFSQCAAEACQFLLTLPDLDVHVGRRLVAHLGQVVSAASPIPLTVQVPSAPRLCYSPPVSPASDAPPPPPRGGETPPPPALSSTPSAQDLARPMQGLLMTVRERWRGRSSPSSTERRDMWRPW